jgi:4-hydroxy-4-methyl-2-oxoglutarate aldolase
VITVNPKPARRIHPELVDRYRKTSFPTIGHVRYDGFVDSKIQCIDPDPHVKVVGHAVTVRTVAPDSTVVHKVLEMLEPGDVLVIDIGGNEQVACIGEVVALAAHVRGTPVVVDGAVTDVREILEMGQKVWARSRSALTTKILGIDGEINGAVHCGGVTVHPGDLVLADCNGVVIISPETAADLIDRVEAMEQAEVPTRKAVLNGTPLASLSKAKEYFK